MYVLFLVVIFTQNCLIILQLVPNSKDNVLVCLELIIRQNQTTSFEKCNKSCSISSVVSAMTIFYLFVNKVLRVVQ